MSEAKELANEEEMEARYGEAMKAEERAREVCPYSEHEKGHPVFPGGKCAYCEHYKKAYREGQSNPNAAAVARVLREAAKVRTPFPKQTEGDEVLWLLAQSDMDEAIREKINP